jgi:hypothetical protein
LAKQAQTLSQAKSVNHLPLIPKATDPRAELFFLLGRIEGQGVEGAARIVSLVIDLTSAPFAPASVGVE